MVSVFILDDHPIVREGIKQIVQESGEFIVTGEAATGEETIATLMKNPCDLAIIDISIPGMNGLEVLSKMKQKGIDIKVVIMSRHQESQYAIRAFKLGANGYLNKQIVGEELLIALKRVVRGRRYITPELAEEILDFSIETDSEEPLYTRLSEREFQVFERLANGKTIAESSRELNLSPNTIATYRQRILNKLHLKNNAQLMHYAVEQHLFD